MRRILWTTGVITLITTGLAAGNAAGQDQAAAKPAGEEKTLTIGDKAPDIDIEHWVKGVEMDRRGNFEPLKSFGDGKVYVLEFWATWCGPCLVGMPHLSELQEKHADDDVTIIGVSNETLPKVIDFLFLNDRRDGKLNNDRTHYTLTTDPDQSVWNDFFRAAGQRGIPNAFIIGKSGHIEWNGHPMNMDEPLKAVVSGEWDRGAFKAQWEKEQKAEREAMAARPAMTDARRNQDWPALIKIFDDLIAANPESSTYKIQKFQLMLGQMNQPAKAYDYGLKVAKAHWDETTVLNGLAWFVADDATVATRDLDFALTLATRAAELSEHKEASILDTLARVYYEKGDLKNAVKWQTNAAENTVEGAMRDGILESLEKYRKEAASR